MLDLVRSRLFDHFSKYSCQFGRILTRIHHPSLHLLSTSKIFLLFRTRLNPIYLYTRIFLAACPRIGLAGLSLSLSTKELAIGVVAVPLGAIGADPAD